MSASTATTAAPVAARWRMNREDRVVLPLPPFPTKAIFMFSKPSGANAARAGRT
ncbi:hypothetical protein SGLAM104S_02844 [Streptomyces glaucescens]